MADKLRDAGPDEQPVIPSGQLRDASPDEQPDLAQIAAPQPVAEQPAPNWVDHAVQYGYDGASPVAPPGSFIKRVTKPEDPVMTQLWGALANAKDAAVSGFGDDPLVGIHPGSETEKWLQEKGIFAQPGAPADLRRITESIVRPIAGIADLVGRLGSAGVEGLASLAGSAAAEVAKKTTGDEDAAREDMQGMVEWAAMRGDMMQFTKAHITPDGKVMDLNIGTPPKPEHFMQAADALTDGKGTPEVAEKLSQIYDEHGIHPAEMVQEANENPAIRASLVSKNKFSQPEGLPMLEKPEDVPPPGGKPPVPPSGGDLGGLHGEPEPQPHPLQEAADNIWDKLSVNEGDIKDERAWSWSRFYTSAVDKFNPWLDAVKASVSGDAYKDLGTADNPYRLARLVPGWQWVAHGFLDQGTRDFASSKIVGEGMKDIMGDVAKIKPEIPGYTAQDEFRLFLTSARARELSLRDIDHPIDDDDAIKIGRALAPKYGDLERRVLEYQNRMAAYARDAGVLSRAGFKAMTEANKFYVPFYRVVAQAAKRSGSSLGQSFEATDPFFKIEGSENYKIIDPLESIVKDTYLITSMAQKNVAAVKMIDMLLQRDQLISKTKLGKALGREIVGYEPGGRDVVKRDPLTNRRIEAPSNERNALVDVMGNYEGFRAPSTSTLGEAYAENPGVRMGDARPEDLAPAFETFLRKDADNEVSVLRDGKRYTYKVDPELARSMKQLDTQTVNWLTKYMSYPASTLRAGAVLTPDFWLRHSFRDYLYAFTSTVGGVFTPMDSIRGMMAFAVHSDKFMNFVSKLPVKPIGAEALHAEFWDAMHHGAGGTSFLQSDRRGIQGDLNRIAQEHPDLWSRSYNVVMDPSASVWQKSKAMLGGMPLGALQRTYHGAQFVTEMVTSATHIGAYIRDQRLNKVQKEASRALTIPELKGTSMQPAEHLDPAESVRAYHELVRLPQHESNALAEARTTDVERANRGELDPNSNYMGFGWRPRSTNTAPKFMPDELMPPRLDTPEKRAKLHSAWVARDTAVDAQRIGTKLKAWNMISAFANIKIQESDKLARSLWENPVDTGMKIAVGVTLPSVLLWAVNHDQSWYQDMPDWEKNAFWLIHIPSWENATAEQASVRKRDMIRLQDGMLQVDNGTTFRIPKPFTMGVLFGSGPERLLDAWKRDRPEEVTHWLKSLQESTVGDIAPSVGMPMMEQYANRSMMTGGNLIPDRLQKQLPEYQYNDYTSPTAKALGRLIGAVPYIGKLDLGGQAFASPQIIQNYIRQWTGTGGMYALKLADKIGQKAGVYDDTNNAASTLADDPVVKAFVVRYPGMGAQPIQDLYDKASEIEMVQNTYKRLMKDGDIDAANKLVAMHGDELTIQVKSFKESISKISGVVHQINISKTMEPFEKRQMIDSLYYQAINIANQGVAMIEQAKKAAENVHQ